MLDLSPFCSEDPLRPYLHQPWSRAGKTYATNGHVIVRVPSREGDTPAGIHSPDGDKPFLAADLESSPQPLPRYELPPNVGDKDCTKCEGRGHEHDCPDCECECESCGGSGKAGVEDVSVDFCGAILNAKYVRLLQTLPNIRIAANGKGQLKLNPLYFIFDGGDGLLMPMSVKMATHITVKAP